MAENGKKQGYIVVEGAKVKCTLGSLSESPLKIKHKDDDKYYVNEKKVATWLEDDTDHMNFGACKRSTPPPACTPDIKWSDYYENAEFGRQKVLIDKSQGNCKYKGTVTISRHGQTAQPSSRLYKKHNKNTYDIFMLSPQVAASKGKQPPSVSRIDIGGTPALPVPANREVAFEIGGPVKTILLVATVGKNEDAGLVNWVFYKGDTQRTALKTYLEYGKIFPVQLEELPEGKTTIFGYGKTPSGESTKIIINRKHNKLERIGLNLYNGPAGKTVEIPKKTPAIFTPVYTFPRSASSSAGMGSFFASKTVWRIKDTAGNILYSTSRGLSTERKNGTVSASILSGTLIATFQNNGSYIIELEDSTLIKTGMAPEVKNLTVKVKKRAVSDIVNKGGEKIRKTGTIQLAASGITFDYGGIVGLGKRVFWFVQKDGGKVIPLGLREEINMNVATLMEEFRKQKQPLVDPYGIYKFQVFGEEKPIMTIGRGADTAVIEVAKNRLESIGGPEKIPTGTTATYEARLLMPPVPGENIRWSKTGDSSAVLTPSGDAKEATLEIKTPAKITLSARLEGYEVSNRPIEKTVEAAGVSLNKALWCYANGKRRAETGWDEENYIYISLEGLTQVPVKIKVWAEHPEYGLPKTFTQPECLLQSTDTVLDEKGSCRLSFIAGKEIKEKLQKIKPDPGWQAHLIFTLEFTGSKPLNLSHITLSQKQGGGEVPAVVSEGKNLYLVLDAGECLRVPAPPRITAINFSNEAATDIQVGATQYGKKHTIWVNTVGMSKEKLVVIVYKQLLKDDMKETYNHKEKSFAATAQVKKYPAEEVGADGLLSLDFIPEKKDSDADPQLFYVAVYSEQKNEKGEIKLIEKGSQLRPLESLPFDKELNKDATQVGIVMPTLKEGQTPTAEQLKEIESKFFHFYNPLYVSETGTMAEQQVVSPVLVERGENHKATCPRCNAPVTVADLKQIFRQVPDETLKVVAETYTKYMEDLKMNTCWNKAHFFAQARVEVGPSFEIKNPESFNYYWESLISTFSAFRTEEGRRKAQEWGRKIRKVGAAGYVPVSEENQKKIAEYAYGPGTKKGKELGNTEEGDGWRFRGRGLIQLTGRTNYTAINAYCTRYKELGDIVLHSDLVTEIRMAVFSSMAYWHKNAIYNDANGKKDTEAACDKVGDDVKVKDEEGKDSMNHAEKQKMFNKYTSIAFRIDECLWGEVKDGLDIDNSDLKIQQGIDWLLTKAITQEELVNKKQYKVRYANDTNRTAESGENTMDCSELVCRYLQKIEWSKDVKYLITRGLYDYAQKHPEWLQIHNDTSYKPQKGDIFIWKNLGNGMGHTGVIVNYEEIKNDQGGIDEVVTTIEAISSPEYPYGYKGKSALDMHGVIKLKWLRKSRHLLGHPLKNKAGDNLSSCRFYTPKVHYSKANK